VTRLKAFTSDTFRSLQTRNFRLFFAGQLVYNTGTWMQTVAVGWLVLQLTRSGVAVGVVTALQFLPSLLFGIYGGVVADRFDKRRTLLGTQTGMAICAAILAAVTLAGSVQLWMVYLLTFASGCFTSIDTPVRQAFVSEMVPPEGLPNAIALNSAMFNLSRIAGPAVGALVIKAFGVGPCFAVNAGSFVAVIAGLVMMRPAELYRGRPLARAKGQIREGLRYVWNNPVLRSTILVMTVVGTLAFNWTVSLPLLAKFTFHGDAGTYGLMTTLMGAGALIGALSSARATPSPRRLAGSCLAFGVLMTLAAAAPNRPLEYVVIVATGVASMTFLACANSICQLSSTPRMRAG
jgi:MFS family permease